MTGAPKIVLLGMMTKMPVAGVVWQNLHYLEGFRRLGFETYYVEAHARVPSMFMETETDDGSEKAAAFIDRVMRRFGFKDRWAYHALHGDRRCFGIDSPRLERLYRDAALIVNLHGGTEPLPEHAASSRLVYVETDPVELQIELDDGLQRTIDFLEPHAAFFTFAENYGNEDCSLPVSERFLFQTTRQPVVLDFWSSLSEQPGRLYTTVGNWRQPWRSVRFEGELLHWSKHHEFLRVLGLPARAGERFELALSSYEPEDCRLLEEHGWRVRHALDVSSELDPYRAYIAGSRGEFTVAKEQNVRLRTGWFSDRSATYLAAGRPVVTQETGFSNAIPTGEGLFGFVDLDGIVDAVDTIERDYAAHAAAAQDLAAEFFASDRVLGTLLEQVGLAPSRPRARRAPLPPDLVLEPISRRPTVLPDLTLEAVAGRAVPERPIRLDPRLRSRLASIVIPTAGSLPFLRLCLESVLENTGHDGYEVIVVDNGSTDGTASYLRRLAGANPQVRPLRNRTNAGYSAAVNQGLNAARGRWLVLLNDDVIVPPGWLGALVRHLQEPEVGLVGALANRAGNEAQIDAPYRTYAEFLAFSRARFSAAPELRDVRTATFFCAALRRDTWEEIGPLDERFGVGTFEDDDYAMRLRAAGLRVVLAENTYVHHFGQVTLGNLPAPEEYGELLRRNRRVFEDKWGVAWQPYARRPNPAYAALVASVRSIVERSVPRGATVAVLSRGDDGLLEIEGRRAWHFPRDAGGAYAGHHPSTSQEAIALLEQARAEGADFLAIPEPMRWWLEHYQGFARYLRDHLPEIESSAECAVYDLAPRDGARGASAA